MACLAQWAFRHLELHTIGHKAARDAQWYHRLAKWHPSSHKSSLTTTFWSNGKVLLVVAQREGGSPTPIPPYFGIGIYIAGHLALCKGVVLHRMFCRISESFSPLPAAP